MEVVVGLDGLADALRAIVREEVMAAAERGGDDSWIDAKGAAEHLGMTEDAIRSLVKRRPEMSEPIPVNKTPGGRLLFSRAELDAWVRGEAHDG